MNKLNIRKVLLKKEPKFIKCQKRTEDIVMRV